MTHTPEPWAVIPPDEDTRDWYIARSRLDPETGLPAGVRHIPRHLRDGRDYYIAIVLRGGREKTDGEANANLIVMAPKLLKACRRALNVISKSYITCERCDDDEFCTFHDRAIQDLQHVIEKAENG
jgi:hypothetical protein